MLSSAFDSFSTHAKTDSKLTSLPFAKHHMDALTIRLIDGVPTLALIHKENKGIKGILKMTVQFADLSRVTSTERSHDALILHAEGPFRHNCEIVLDNYNIKNPIDVITSRLMAHLCDETSIEIHDIYVDDAIKAVENALIEIKNQDTSKLPTYYSQSDIRIDEIKYANVERTIMADFANSDEAKIINLLRILQSILTFALTLMLFCTIAYIVDMQPTAACTAIALCIICAITLSMPITITTIERNALNDAYEKSGLLPHCKASLIREENIRYLLFERPSRDTQFGCEATLVRIGGEDNATWCFEQDTSTMAFETPGIWRVNADRKRLYRELLPSRDIKYMEEINVFEIADIFVPSLPTIASKASTLV